MHFLEYFSCLIFPIANIFLLEKQFVTYNNAQQILLVLSWEESSALIIFSITKETVVEIKSLLLNGIFLCRGFQEPAL